MRTQDTSSRARPVARATAGTPSAGDAFGELLRRGFFRGRLQRIPTIQHELRGGAMRTVECTDEHLAEIRGAGV
jgi:hypothetical protein